MALAGHKNDITFLRKGACGLNGLLAIGNAQYCFFLLERYASLHFMDNSIWVFIPGIIRSQYHLVRIVRGYFCHDRSLGFVAVSTATYHSNDMAALHIYFMNRFQYILQG